MLCRICQRSFNWDQQRAHTAHHLKVVAAGGLCKTARQFMKTAAWEVLQGRVTVDMPNSREAAKLTIALAMWAEAIEKGIPLYFFDEFMSDYLRFLDVFSRKSTPDQISEALSWIATWDEYQLSSADEFSSDQFEEEV